MKHLVIITTVIIYSVLLISSCSDRVQGVPAEYRTVNGVQLTCPKDIMHPSTDILCRVAVTTNRTIVSESTGLSIWMEDGVNLTQSGIEAIERGIKKTLDKSVCKGYGQLGWRALRHNDYTVSVLRASEVDSQGNPAYRWPCGPYCGTEYDKGGYILVAGQMAAAGKPYGNIIVLPEPKEDRLSYTEDGSEFETEHVVTAWYDGALFEATKLHIGNGHPIYSCTTPIQNLFLVEPEAPMNKVSYPRPTI